jgi:superfamily I DNA/RNA helicase
MNQIKCTTLHSFCALLLRQYSDKDKKDFSVYDDQDSKKIIKSLMIEKGIDIMTTNPGRVGFSI